MACVPRGSPCRSGCRAAPPARCQTVTSLYLGRTGNSRLMAAHSSQTVAHHHNAAATDRLSSLYGIHFSLPLLTSIYHPPAYPHLTHTFPVPPPSSSFTPTILLHSPPLISSLSSHLTKPILSPHHSIFPPPSSPSINLPIHHHSPFFTFLYRTPNTPFTSPPFLL
jgi:hypothetical protein